MATAATYNIVGNHEDLLDILTTVDPEETPMFSTLPKGKPPTNVLTEWVADRLDNPTITGKVEGAEVTTHKNQGAGRVLLSNRLQTDFETFAVTREQQKVSDPAGLADMLAGSKAKAALQLKRNMAAAVGSDNEAVVSNGTVAGQSRAMGKWTDPANSNIAASVRMPAGSLGVTSTTTSGVTTFMTEADFNKVLQSSYEASGKKNNFTLYAGSRLKSTISNYQRLSASSTNNVYQVQQDAATKTVTLCVNIYDGDFGFVQIVPDLFLGLKGNAALDDDARDRGYLIPAGAVNIGFAEAPTTVDQPDGGQGPHGFIESMWSLRAMNPRALGKFHRVFVS